MTTDKIHKIRLVIGDWSRDGHSQTSDAYIVCNVSRRDLEAAYAKGTKMCGVDITKEVCHDYEDSIISEQHINKLMASKVELPSDIIDSLGKKHRDKIYVDVDLFMQLYMNVAKLGNPSIQYDMDEIPPAIYIGGYGLFY